MKKHFSVLALLLLTVACQQNKRLPRIAIAGLAIESSTFSPQITQEEDFHTLYGNDVLDYYPFLKKGSEDIKRAQWFPTLKAKALPGGGRITRGL